METNFRRIKFNKNKYESICMAEPKLIFNTFKNFLEENYGHSCEKVDGEYLFIKGELPVCLVAHVDVVLHSAYEFHYCEQENIVFSLSGADDDRNGIYSIAEIVCKGYRPSILLLDKEESGGLGALTFIEKHKYFPAKIKFFIELDRQGHNDMVTYDYKNNKFDKDICMFGFKKQIGTFSDITYLAPYYNRGGVNLSVGYSLEHTVGCHTYIDSMMATIAKVCSILNNIDKMPTYTWGKKEHLKQKKDINEAIILSKQYKNISNLAGHRYPLNPAYDDYLEYYGELDNKVQDDYSINNYHYSYKDFYPDF